MSASPGDICEHGGNWVVYAAYINRNYLMEQAYFEAFCQIFITDGVTELSTVTFGGGKVND